MDAKPTAESDAPEADPLTEALGAFIDAPTWLASYRRLREHPELLSEAADAALAEWQAAAVDAGDEESAVLFTEHRDLLRRARVVGARAVMAEKLETTPEELDAALLIPEVPFAFEDAMHRADEAETRYVDTGDLSALDEAVAAWLQILDNPAFAEASDSFQLGALNDAAGVFLRGYHAVGDLAYLDRALAFWRDVVHRAPADSPDRAVFLNNLGAGLSARSIHTGLSEDVAIAVDAYRASLAVTPIDSPERARRLSNLGTGLRELAVRAGSGSDLAKAVAVLKEAVSCAPAIPSIQAMCFNNLGNGLSDRYALTNMPEDLNAAIEAYESAIMHLPAHAPERPISLNNLANGLSDRYARKGEPEDLDAAITLYAEAADLTLPHSPFWPMYRNNLGAALSDRYERTRQLEDLDSAIDAYVAAAGRTPPDSPDWAIYRNNIGVGLGARYSHTGQVDDLIQAIAAWQDAVDHAQDAPNWPIYINNLGNGLRERYERTKQSEDLEAAITAYKAGVAGTSVNSPRHAGCLSNLGNGLRDRYAWTQRPKDLDEAIDAYHAAVNLTPADSPDSAMYLNNLGLGLRDRYHLTHHPADLDATVAAYQQAIATLERALLNSPVTFMLGQQARWLGLYAQSVDVLVDAARPVEALLTAELGKSRLLVGLMGRGDLPPPPGVPADLIAREQALAGQLQALDTAELARRDAVRSGTIGHSIADRAASANELRAIWAELEGYNQMVREYVAIRRGDQLNQDGLARLAAISGPGVALLSLVDTGEQTVVFLWRLGETEPTIHTTTFSDPVKGIIHNQPLRYEFLDNYEEEVMERAELRRLGRPLTHHWRTLGRVLFGSLLPHLAGIRHLIIAPHSAYHLLPLHALWLNEARDTLLDYCAVTYVPALSVVERVLRREKVYGSRAVVAGFTPAEPTTEDGRRERELFLGEAIAVAQQLDVVPLLGSDANVVALQQATIEPLRHLHLSCHGYFDTQDALESGVLLADSIYTARQFLTDRLRANLVTLSACETGLSRSLGGDEMAGLSMALLSAGASSLLLGLWSVNAETTALMMVDFYKRLRGLDCVPDKAEALRQTMLALRDGRLIPPQPERDFDPSDPYYWAPFVLVGDWR